MKPKGAFEVNFGKTVIGMLVAVGATILMTSPSMAHSTFKKEMAKKYPEKKVSCNACHVEKKPKTERNSFGNLFHKQFADLELSKNFKAKKGAEKKEYEAKVMIPAFEKAFKNVSAMTYDDIIKAGLVPGIDIPSGE